MDPEQESPSLDQTIAEEYRAILERNSAEETPGEQLDKAAKDDAPPEEETEEQKAERARDEQGRFAKQAKASKPKEEKSAAPAEPSSPAPKGSAATPSASPATPAAAEPAAEQVVRTDGRPIDLSRPPAEWKPAAKAAWAGLPEPIRAEIHRREVDAYRKFSETAPDAEFGRNVRSIGERFRQIVDLDGGGDVGKAVASFFQTAQLLRFGTPAQKRQAVDYLEQYYGVPARQAAQPQYVQQQDGTWREVTPQQQPAAQQQAFQDPRVDQLMASISAREQAQVREEEQRANSVTAKFLSAVNEKGEPLYPFIDNVLDDMTERVKSLRLRGIGHEEALKQAYDAAVWANPETRAELVKQQAAQLEAQRREENLRRTAEAKRRAAGNVSPRGAHPQERPTGKMEDTIAETYREIVSRA